MDLQGGTQKPTTSNMQRMQEAASAQLRLTFPVSSGSQHRLKELEWVPVAQHQEKDKKEDDKDCRKLEPVKEKQESSKTSAAVEADYAAILMPPPPLPRPATDVTDKVFNEANPMVGVKKVFFA